MRLPHGETVTVRRWLAWSGGSPLGEPLEWALHPVAFAPRDAATDPAARRGAVIPAADLLCPDPDVRLAPHDLITRTTGEVAEVTGTVKRYVSPLTGWRAGAVAAVTLLVEQGLEVVRVWTSGEREDDYGNVEEAPGGEPVLVHGITFEPLPAAEDASEGQRADPRARITGRGLSVLDAFAEVEWPVGSGRRWEVDGVPVHWPWPPSTPYTRAELRERR